MKLYEPGNNWIHSGLKLAQVWQIRVNYRDYSWLKIRLATISVTKDCGSEQEA
jgi:hypothetical protein